MNMSTRTPLGVGVIGMGMMGKSFAQICSQLWEAKLIGVSDVVEEAGKAAADTFDVPFYHDWNELIARPDVQAVIVATPESAHVEPTIAALERGKGVLVEKPIADNMAGALRIVAAAEKAGGVLLVGHVQRFITQYALAKQLVDEGKIGEVQYIQTRKLNGKSAQNRLRGRSSLPIFLGVHDYDIVRWFAGSEPARIYAESQFVVLKKMGFDVEDTNMAMISFKNGALAACETGWILPPGHPNTSDHRLWIQGTDGRIDIELFNQGMVVAMNDRSNIPGVAFMPRVDGDIRGPFIEEVRHFLACIRDGVELKITPQDAVAALGIAEAVIESARTHQPVLL
jgi:predicted dehydrogenase